MTARESKKDPAGSQPNQRRGRKYLLLSLLAATGAVAATYGVLHLREQPIREARNALESGETEEAMRLLSEYLEEHPDDGAALALQARGMVALGRPTTAIRIFETVGPSTPEDFHALARAFLLRGEWSSGLATLEHVVELQPNNADAWYELTTCRTRLGRFTAALESAHRFAQTGSEARGNVYLGSIHNDLGNHEAAVKAYARVLELDPDAADLQVPPEEFFLQYGSTLLASGDADAALVMAQRAIALRPSGESYALAAKCWKQQGSVEAAVDAWKMAIDLAPQSVEPRLELANQALQRRDHRAALQLLKPVAHPEPATAAVSFTVQRALTIAGEKEQAANWLAVTQKLRRREERDNALANLLREQPNSYWAQVVRAYRFAEEGNRRQAEMIVKALADTGAADEPFLASLAASLAEQKPLPSLDDIPVRSTDREP